MQSEKAGQRLIVIILNYRNSLKEMVYIWMWRLRKGKSADQLTDEELASMPRVKSLFNQFWEEKMKEMDKGESNEIKNLTKLA